MANAANAAIGMIETKGLVALVQATDAMLKAAPVQYAGWRKIGSGLATVFVTGDVGAVRAAVEAGKQVASEEGLLVNTVVIPGPHPDLIAEII